jgi:hypothetical protein
MAVMMAVLRVINSVELQSLGEPSAPFDEL